MLKAELGDLLFYIIFAVVILSGLLEKVAKSKRQQQQAATPRPPQPYDDFGNVEEQTPSPKQAPPKSLEEVMRRMLESVETPEQKEVSFPEAQELITKEVQSLEYIPTSGRHFHHPEEVQIRGRFGYEPISPVLIEEEKDEAVEFFEYDFDIRQAVIASEILNRRY